MNETKSTGVTQATLCEAMVDASLDGLLAFDREFRYVHWNAAMEKISGLRAEDVIGKGALELFPFLLESGEDKVFREVLRGKRISTKHRAFSIDSTGRKGFFDASYSPMYGNDREIVGAIAVIRDTTERYLAEGQMHESEARFKTMADVAPVLLWMARTDGMCTFFNQTWLSFTGRTLEQEWGVGWAEGVHFEDFQRCVDTYMEAFNARQVFEMEYRLRRADGEFRWILDRGTPRYTPDGAFAGYIGSCVDITDRKALESDLRHAVRARDEFLSIASHELRTPLTALQLQVESLERTLEKRPEEGLRSGRFAQNARAASKQTVRVVDLVDTLLDVSKIAAGRLVLKLEELDFAGLVREIAERFRVAAADAGCELEIRLSDDALGRWDRLRVEQVVTNLLSNAFKYGMGKPVQVLVQSSEDEVQLNVVDQGIGIPAEKQAHIFERFARAVPVRNYGGFGLGLWIAKHLVESMGGSITVVSEPTHGANFQIILPKIPPEYASSPPRRDSDLAFASS